MGGVLICFIVFVYNPRANPITDSDLAAYVQEYDEYSGRRSLLMSLGLLCYTSFVETYPFLSQLLDNGYKVLGHDGYPIPVITSHRVSGWNLNINEIKPRRVRSKLFIISTLLNILSPKQFIKYKPLQIILLQQYIINYTIYYSKCITIKIL